MANVVISSSDLRAACAEARRWMLSRAHNRIAAFDALVAERSADMADAQEARLSSRILRRFGLRPVPVDRFRAMAGGFHAMSRLVRLLAVDMLREVRIGMLLERAQEGGLVELSLEDAALIDLDPERLPKPFQAPPATA